MHKKETFHELLLDDISTQYGAISRADIQNQGVNEQYASEMLLTQSSLIGPFIPANQSELLVETCTNSEEVESESSKSNDYNFLADLAHSTSVSMTHLRKYAGL